MELKGIVSIEVGTDTKESLTFFEVQKIKDEITDKFGDVLEKILEKHGIVNTQIYPAHCDELEVVSPLSNAVRRRE